MSNRRTTLATPRPLASRPLQLSILVLLILPLVACGRIANFVNPALTPQGTVRPDITAEPDGDSAAISGPTETLGPNSTASPSTLDPAATRSTPSLVLFQDDFSDPGSGWYRVTQADGQSNYADGGYRIWVNLPYTDIWSRPNLSFDDVRIEVDAIKMGGEENNRYGVICRVSEEGSFYLFVISSDGYYGIGKLREGELELLGMDGMRPSEIISQGAATNHIRADCIGSQLALYVNGEKLAEVEDSEFTSGDVGLIAGTYDLPGTDIEFDNFTVLQP